MAPLVRILLQDLVCSDLWTEKLAQSPDSTTEFSEKLLICADLFLRRSRAVDVELLLKALGKEFQEMCMADSPGVTVKIREQFNWAKGLEICLQALTGPTAPHDDQVGIASTIMSYFWNSAPIC